MNKIHDKQLKTESKDGWNEKREIDIQKLKKIKFFNCKVRIRINLSSFGLIQMRKLI